MAEYSYDRKYFERLVSRNKFQIWARSFFFPPLQPLLKGNVLDLGCGIGELADYVEKKSQYFGVDINDSTAKSMRQNSSELHPPRFADSLI